MAATKAKTSVSASNGIPAMPTKDTHAVLTTKDLGFVSAVVFDGTPDRNGKQVSSNVWLAIPSQKKIGSLYIGVISEGRWQPIDDFALESNGFHVSDLADFLNGSRKKSGPTAAALSGILSRIVRRVAVNDFQDDRELSRQKTAATIEAKAKGRLELVKSMMD